MSQRCSWSSLQLTNNHKIIKPSLKKVGLIYSPTKIRLVVSSYFELSLASFFSFFPNADADQVIICVDNDFISNLQHFLLGKIGGIQLIEGKIS